MTILIIAAVCLSEVPLLVALCRAAARGDRALPPGGWPSTSHEFSLAA